MTSFTAPGLRLTQDTYIGWSGEKQNGWYGRGTTFWLADPIPPVWHEFVERGEAEWVRLGIQDARVVSAEKT